VASLVVLSSIELDSYIDYGHSVLSLSKWHNKQLVSFYASVNKKIEGKILGQVESVCASSSMQPSPLLLTRSSDRGAVNLRFLTHVSGWRQAAVLVRGRFKPRTTPRYGSSPPGEALQQPQGAVCKVLCPHGGSIPYSVCSGNFVPMYSKVFFVVNWLCIVPWKLYV
jgi:hypothetical protein